MSLEKGEREGQWAARFPRNDGLVCSHEAHILLANMGNIDWRPCLNLWAVVEYICKYATKAPEGSKRLGDVLGDAVDEVCKYTKDGEPVDFLQKSLRKFYTRTLGGRDYTIFEAIFLGLRLPLMLSLMPVVSLNTTGARKLKSQWQMRDAGPDDEIAWQSKIDKFDRRLELLRKQFPKPEQDALRVYWEGMLRATSLYEFYWKYNVYRGRIHKTTQDVCLMVTPALPASAASVLHDRHEVYARTCVVAYWRCMSSRERASMWNKLPIKEPWFFGGTVLEPPIPHASARPSELDRFLGVQDLVAAFDGRKTEELVWEVAPAARSAQYVFKRREFKPGVSYGWALALMEMLVDPVLLEWVPEYVVEQYKRWNPFFVDSLRKVHQKWSEPPKPPAEQEQEPTQPHVDPEGRPPRASNRAFLCQVHKRMKESQQAQQAGKEEEKKAQNCEDESASGSDSAQASSVEGPGPVDAEQLEEEQRDRLVYDALPTLGADGPEGGDAADDWSKATAEERLSAAGPGETAPAVPSVAKLLAPSGSDAAVNPEGYDWQQNNFVPRAHALKLQDLWKRWCKQDVFTADDLRGVDADMLGGGDDELDPWQAFARDIMALRDAPAVRKPLRLIMTGTAGSGKSRTIKAAVRARSFRSVQGKFDAKRSRRACVLAAPTGCASFQLKNGATTVHRAFGVPVGFCGKARNRNTEAFARRQARLRGAELIIIDEFSMVGRQMLGKIVYKTSECLPGRASLGGKDAALSGDPKQAAPIGDEPMFRYGAYRGTGLNKPRKGDRAEDAPSLADFTRMGELLREEFQDVAILRDVHRISRAPEGSDAVASAQYGAEADRFLEVTTGMANCTWTPQDHAWFATRNRSALSKTPEGRLELEAFEEAPLLMDGKKPNRQGEDGSTQVNKEHLFRLAAREGKPVLSIEALHGGYEEGSRPELMFDEDFKGLESHLLLCVGARVLLTSNLWVEAGLMNGALGTVRGFIWPEGGDPHAAKKELRAPACVVVEFDDIDLGQEAARDARGDPIVCDGRVSYQRRNFFPTLLETLGTDASGVPRACRCVPIFQYTTNAESDDKVSRHQFPLVLAWALTHWKAQGMTLRRARIRMGKRTATQPGIGFVAVTRVRHFRDLVFDVDLPAWEHFQEAQWKPNFRARRRFEWRLEAKASRTLRKYGFCRADEWSREDATLAGKLLQGLERKAAERRRDMQLGDHPDEWCWQNEEVPVEALLLKQVRDHSGEDAELRQRTESIARRLLGPWHRPAVLEALGVLIPREYHPRFDGKKPRGRGKREPGMTVQLQAGAWKIDAFEEQNLLGVAPGVEGRLLKGVLDFFVIVLRRLCDRLQLPVSLAPHKLGLDLQLAHSEEDMALTLLKWESYKHWGQLVASTADAEIFLAVVPVEDAALLRDCVLVAISPSDANERLGQASGYVVDIYDDVGRSALAERLARNAVKLLTPKPPPVETRQHPATGERSRHERGFTSLGMLLAALLRKAGHSFHDPAQPDFAAKVRRSLGACLQALREEADKRGNRDVLVQLGAPEGCKAFLRVLSAPLETEARPSGQQQPPGQVRVKAIHVAAFQPLKILTWNINARGKSSLAPKSFTVADKMAATQQEICRWRPDLCALQECADALPLPGLASLYDFVGSAPAEHCGHIHCYVRKGLRAVLLGAPKNCPAVLLRVEVGDGTTLDVAAVHLMPGTSGRDSRKLQLRAALGMLRPGSQLIVGDMNVRPDEVPNLLALGHYRNADYAGSSWHPTKSRYDDSHELKTFRGPGFAFDRIFFAGAVCVEACLLGHGRVYSEGASFSLSDHFALLGFVDLHSSHQAAAHGSEVRRERRGALAAVRDQVSLQERCVVSEMSRAGRQAAARDWAQVDAKAQAAAMRKQRDEIKARRQHRDALWDSAFGPRSLFRNEAAAPEPPGRPREISLMQGLLPPCLPPLLPWPMQGAGALPALGQVFLRVREIALRVQQHKRDCEQDVSTCLCCALGAMGQKYNSHGAQHVERTASLPLACDLLSGVHHLQAKLFASEQQTLPWPGVDEPPDCRLTVTESLFAFAEEVRQCCPECGAGTTRYEKRFILDLPAPQQPGTRHTVPDLYLERCQPHACADAGRCVTEGCAGKTNRLVEQRRLAHLPEVLFVTIARVGVGGAGNRCPVHADDYLSLPGCGNAQLAAAVYTNRASVARVRYTCALRGPDGCFWLFDAQRPPRRLEGDVAELCCHAVELLVYIPSGANLVSQASWGQRLRQPDISAESAQRGAPVDVPAPAPAAAAQEPKQETPREHVGRRPPAKASRPRRAPQRQADSVAMRESQNPLWFLFEQGEAQSQDRRGDPEDTSASQRSHPQPGGKKVAMETTRLWEHLLGHCVVPGDVVSAILAGLQERFGKGRAWELANARWICDLENWANLAQEVRNLCPADAALALPYVLHPVKEVVFAVVRLILAQDAANVSVTMRDEDKLDQLRASGWLWKEASTWGENDCLIDSLAQTMEAQQIIRGTGADGALTESDRKHACEAARQHLLHSAALHPRDRYGRPQWDAYLQHHRHAEVLLRFLLRRFVAGPRPLPPAGVDLVVHSRLDTEAIPADRVTLCEDVRDPRARKPELHVFNWTGRELEGYHYDALVFDARPVVLDPQPPEPAAPRALLKRRRGDGRGRSAQDARAPLDLTSPPRAAFTTEGERSTAASSSTARVVSGFGSERREDVVADRQQLEADMVERARHRREQGMRGRVRDFQGRDVDRSGGGAWHAGRR